MKRIEQLLGPTGRMISASKTGYSAAHPHHVVVFNANVCIGQAKRWHGDLDLTLDEPRLVQLAVELGHPVAVLFERDARFATELDPRIENAVLVVYPDGRSRIDEGVCTRAANGSLHSRPQPGG